jgi:bacterioferritin
MSQHQQVSAQLNQILNLQLVAIDQLYLHARLYKNWGLGALAELSSENSRQLMIQANQLFDHIRQRNEKPETITPDSLLTGAAILQCLELDHKMVAQCRTAYVKTIEICNAINDSRSIDLLKQFISQSENHHDWLHTELDYIHTRGLQAFIRNEMGINQYWKLAAS